jgi:hypothetical protein
MARFVPRRPPTAGQHFLRPALFANLLHFRAKRDPQWKEDVISFKLPADQVCEAAWMSLWPSKTQIVNDPGRWYALRAGDTTLNPLAGDRGFLISKMPATSLGSEVGDAAT